ncbi:ChaN family lipoprotein [Piscinibacter koreensis]|uniref:ChaN family lipoprotein n=1 Tax=Piscinibacter koreensis TaxID=2742824 RepID=A0A7Y6TYP1_9BURK|nr:ChaN family lipoprotein [Schlegelella koreensis]NUZ08286.1 ChaN family lipoprotein [Schlegelella koreensis]
MNPHPRRFVLAGLAAGAAAAALAASGCASVPARSWESRLSGDAIVLLGEVHDNPAGHRRRLEVLERAFAAGWRPALAMEQFDRERQGDIDSARRERPGDAAHLIARATGPGEPGWDWALYRPLVELALRHDVPLIAANVSNADTRRIVREGYGAVFGAAERAAVGLDAALAADLQQGQERAIDAGHCNALPAALLPAMARAQFARDAVMAALLRARNGGVVLIAGNGHVRRDLGVPRWLGASGRDVVSVGFLEAGDAATPAQAFDAVVRSPAAERSDPCARFRAAPPR